MLEAPAVQAAEMNCSATWDDWRCSLPAGHDGAHLAKLGEMAARPGVIVSMWETGDDFYRIPAWERRELKPAPPGGRIYGPTGR